MKKTNSNCKLIQKGKSMSSIHQYQQSRLTNKSIDTRKIDSKVSKVSRVSKGQSMIKVHQPLSIESKQNFKQSKVQASKIQQSQTQNSRRQLETKKSYAENNPISFRQSQNNKQLSVKTRETQGNNFQEKQSIRNHSSKFKDGNQKLINENRQLKEKIYRMQETSLEDKEKIKTLITRISEIKRDTKSFQNSVAGMMSKSKTIASYAHIMKTRGLTDRQNIQASNFRNTVNETPFKILQPSTSQSKYSKARQTCGNSQCQQRRKHLQGQLYKQRIKRDQLEDEKIQWQRNRDQLKRQYGQLLCQIQTIREESVCGQQ